MKVVSLEMISAKSPEDVRKLYRNAFGIDSDEARRICSLIVDNGLLRTGSGGLPREHPLIVAVEEVCQSSAGRRAAKEATDAGLPAMAGVDPLLREAIGDKYGTMDTTQWAGTFVATEMEAMGYRQTQKKKMPSDCVAKTAAFFEKRK